MNSLRLLEDLLQHEMRKAFLIDLAELQINLLYLRFERLVAYCLQHHFVLADYSQVAVIQVNDPLCIFHYGSGIRSNEVLTVANPYHQRRTLPGCEHSPLLIPADNGKPVCAFNLIEGQSDCLFG